MTVQLEVAGGGAIALDVQRWRADPDHAEAELLRDLEAPVLDVGCGPGRLAAALAERGVLALGIDPAPAAAGEAVRRGAPVLQRSVFGSLPGEGRWATALLVDGNIGIGGEPVVLLRRVHELLRTGGVVLAEVEPPGSPSGTFTVRVATTGGSRGPWFPWARVGADEWPPLAAGGGFTDPSIVVVGARRFGRAVKP